MNRAKIRELRRGAATCRECARPAKVRTLKDGTQRTLTLCTEHAAIDAARKAGQIK